MIAAIRCHDTRSGRGGTQEVTTKTEIWGKNMLPPDSAAESIPFLHANQVFTIIFLEDLAFSEVRAILDHLLEQDAFLPENQDQGDFYLIEVQECSFQVWVTEMEVIIKRE